LSAVVELIEDVADAVGDVVSDVADAVGDVIDGAVDVVTDAFDWVADEIIRPVVNTVGDVIDSALSDPITTIAKVTAVATGNAWAIPLIDGASVAIQGGDIDDVLKATAISYVGGKVGSAVGQYAGETVGQAMIDAGANEVASQIVSQAAGSAAGSASVAIITGRDPVEAFINGGISGAVGAGLGYINENTEGTFAKLPSEAQNVIKAGLTAAITGQDVTEEQLWNAVLMGENVTKLVNGFVTDNTQLEGAELAAVTAGIQRTAAAAFGGGNVPAALQQSITDYGNVKFKEWVDDSKFGDTINNSIDKVTGKYQDVEDARDAVDTRGQQAITALSNYDSLAEEFNGKIAERDRLRAVYEERKRIFDENPNDASGLDLDNATKAFNEYALALDQEYEDYYKPNFDKYEQEYNTAISDIENNLTPRFDRAVNDLTIAAERMDEELKPAYDEIDRAFVEFMDPNFDAGAYIQLNKLDGLDAQDAYFHWLTEGKDNNLPTSAEGYNEQLKQAKQTYINAMFKQSGIDPTKLTGDQIARVTERVNEFFSNNGDALLTNQQGQKILDLNEFRDGGMFDLKNAASDAIMIQNEIIDDYEINTYTQGLYDKDYYQLSDAEQKQVIGNILDYQATNPDTDLKAVGTINNSAGISDYEIYSGNASVVLNTDTGMLEWEEVNILPEVPTWNSEFNRFVYKDQFAVYSKVGDPIGDLPSGYAEAGIAGRFGGDAEGAEYKGYDNVYFRDAITGEILNPDGYRTDDATYISLYGDNTSTNTGDSINDLKDSNPNAFFSQIGDAVDKGFDFASTSVSKEIQAYVDLYTNIATYVGNTELGKSVAATVDEVLESDTMNDVGYVVVGGTGELLKSFNDMVILANINPASTPLGKFARDMIDLSKDMQTEEYAAASQRINNKFKQDRSSLGDGSFAFEGGSWWGDSGNTLLNIYDGFAEAPGYFLAEYVAKELVQEVPVIAASLATGGAAKVGVTAARQASQQMAKEVAEQAAKRAALATGAVLDLSEATGGAAGQAFDEIYNEAIKAGLSEAEAEQRAQRGAVVAGVTGFLTTGVTMGLMGGNAMEDMVTDRFIKSNIREAGDTMVDKIRQGATISVKEGVQETFEEGAVSGITATHILDFNPDYNVAEAVTLNSTLGAIGGFGTGAGVYTGNAAANALIKFNPTVNKAVTEAPPTSGGAQQVQQVLRDAGITDNEILIDVANSVYDDGYISTTEARNAFRGHPEFAASAADLSSFVGAATDQSITDRVNEFVDQRYVDIQEVKDAARQENVTLTDEQAQEYVSQIEAGGEADVLATVRSDYDAFGTTDQEVRAAFQAAGYNPTDAEVKQFMQEGNEADILAGVSPYVNPRQVTETEARAFFDELGYNPTDQEVADFVGQGGANFEATAPTRVETYVDPRQVTEDEARQFFTDLGYTPTDEQVAEFTAQVSETTQSGNISRYVDPRQVTMAEVQAIADEEGLTLTEALAQTYIGQSEADTFQQTQLDAARAEYDPLATTLEEATQFFADTNYTATPEEIAQFVASKTEEVQTSAIGAYVDPRQMTAEESREFLSAIGYNPTDAEVEQFTGQLNDENFQVTQQAAIDEYVDPRYFDAGEVRAAYEQLGLVDVTQEDVDRFVRQYDPETAEYGAEGFESAVQEELTTYMPTATFNVIKSILGSPAVPDNPNTEVDESKEATGIYAEFEAGATRDEALQSAIDQLSADLGLTEEAIFEQLGITKDELSGEIDAVAADVAALGTTLGEQITGVEETLGGQITDLGTTLGEQITGVEETLGAEIDTVANLVGKPAGEVTQADIDLVNELLTEQENFINLFPDTDFTFTDEQLQYDVTGDGIVDVSDLNLLNSAIQGENVTFAPDSKFAPTGVYQTIGDVQTDLSTQIDENTQQTTDLITEMQTNLLQEINNEADKDKLRDFLQMGQAGMFDAPTVSVRSPDPFQLKYLYDFSSIFANPQQASLFGSPYAEGGMVEDETDALLRLIGR
jgi:hypothetical protein